MVPLGHSHCIIVAKGSHLKGQSHASTRCLDTRKALCLFLELEWKMVSGRSCMRAWPAPRRALDWLINTLLRGQVQPAPFGVIPGFEVWTVSRLNY